MYEISHTNQRKWTIKFLSNSFLIGFLTEFFTLLLIHFYSELVIYDYDFLLLLSYYYITDSYILTNFQFIFATNSIQIRFQILHRNLIAIKERRMKLTDVKDVKNIAIMHGKLTDAVDIVNSSFTHQLLPGLIVCIFAVTFGLYVLFRTLYKMDYEFLLPFVLNSWWVAFYIFFAMASVYNAALMTKMVIKDIILQDN